MKFIYIFCLFLFPFAAVHGQDTQDTTVERADLHFQSTYIYQYKPAFSALYSGPHSISAAEEKQNSLTATLYIGIRLWKGAEVYVNPEVAGGSALSGAFGMGASTNGETFRVGDPAPTLYLARAYIKQTFALSDTYEWSSSDANQLRYKEPAKFIRVYAGKFSLGDFFDNNVYANSPRSQFLNWALMNNSAWDYPANLRGYTAGLVAMLQWNKWDYKLAMAAEPKVANGSELNLDYGMSRGLVAEVSRNITIAKRNGNVRVLLYHNEANMGDYRKAIELKGLTGGIPDIIATEKNGSSKTGAGINIDQQVADNIGVFTRIGWNDGKKETWAFTEVDETACAGVNLGGNMWHRKNDNVGAAVVVTGLSHDHRDYLAAGGLGFQLGDRRLNYANEVVTEVYYSYKPAAYNIWMSGDYQFAAHPGYNKDRGPLSVFSLRVHVAI